MVKTNIAVLISGGGTNLQALIDAEKNGIIKSGQIKLVVSSDPEAYGLKRAEAAGIRTAVVTRKGAGSQVAFEQGIIRELEKDNIELIVLAGFMKILSGEFTRKYENRIINVHPSLIPAFCGKGCYGLKVHEMALEYGVKVTGATVHFVNEVPDGGRIIAQKPVEIMEGDTPEVLQRRVMEQAEWKILPQAAQMVSEKIMKEKTADMNKTDMNQTDMSQHEINQYEINNIGELIENNSYVGRGIVLGKSPAGKAVSAYFIMGRSANSRNRIFALEDGVLYTKPYDESKVEDPSLIIYAALRNYDNRLIVTNGDQTDTIYEFLKKGGSFEDALATRQFEPDFPNLTPRISGIIDFAKAAKGALENRGAAGGTEDAGKFTYKLSILKSLDKNGEKCGRYFFSYEPEKGLGHFIHTYQCDGNPLPTFTGEPERVKIPDSIDELTDLLWNGLDEDNKISLYVRYTDPATGKYEERLINKM